MAPITPPRRHSLRVLLVDDNSASQQAMRRIIINAVRRFGKVAIPSGVMLGDVTIPNEWRQCAGLTTG
jgi:hypothetical protein